MRQSFWVKSRVKSAGVVLSMAAVTALGVAGIGSADAAGRPPAQSWSARSWPAQLAHPVPASCPRGQKLIAPTAGWTDALGVAHVTYQARPGLVALVPPRGLTAGRVTPALLADVGLHAHRQASPSLQRGLVQQVLNLAANQRAPQFCWSGVRAGRAKLAGRRSGTAASGTDLRLGVYYNRTWAGYAITYAQYGHLISSAEGSWKVPKSMTSSAPSAEATWVGIGGDIAGESQGWGLIQTGSEMETGGGYRSVWEYIGSSGCTESSSFCGSYSSVNALYHGDSVFGQVAWNNSTSACFIFTDSSRSTGSWDVCTAVNIPYDRTSAEWIDEWPGDQYYDSPGTVYFTGQAQSSGIDGTGPWSSPFSYTHNAYVMSTGSSGPPSCSTSDVVSYPADSATSSGKGTSEMITCDRSGVDYP